MLYIVTDLIFILLYIAAIILIIIGTGKMQHYRWFVVFPILILVQEIVYSSLWVSMQTAIKLTADSNLVLTLLECIAVVDKIRFPVIALALAFSLFFLTKIRKAAKAKQ